VDSELELSQWWRITAQIIEAGHTVSGDDLPRVLDEAVALVGMTAQMYLVDLAQRTLRPVSKDHRAAVTVEASLAGRAFQFVEVVTGTDLDEGVVLWIPMLDGTDRLGVLRLGLPDGADGDDLGLRQRCSVLAGLVGHLVASKFPYGDVLNVTRRSTPLTVAAVLRNRPVDRLRRTQRCRWPAGTGDPAAAGPRRSRPPRRPAPR
jgi:hypothetical protein